MHEWLELWKKHSNSVGLWILLLITGVMLGRDAFKPNEDRRENEHLKTVSRTKAILNVCLSCSKGACYIFPLTDSYLPSEHVIGPTPVDRPWNVVNVSSIEKRTTTAASGGHFLG